MLTRYWVTTATQTCSTATSPRATIKELLETVFSTRPVPIGYVTRTPVELQSTLVETGSSTSTVALLVVGGDEKGSLESETVKCGHESHGTQTRE
jgi:hypothetical protein